LTFCPFLLLSKAEGNIQYDEKVFDQPGRHTLKIWMIDSGIVFQKFVIDAGGLRPGYLGPPESVYLEL